MTRSVVHPSPPVNVYAPGAAECPTLTVRGHASPESLTNVEASVPHEGLALLARHLVNELVNVATRLTRVETEVVKVSSAMAAERCRYTTITHAEPSEQEVSTDTLLFPRLAHASVPTPVPSSFYFSGAAGEMEGASTSEQQMHDPPVRQRKTSRATPSVRWE